MKKVELTETQLDFIIQGLRTLADDFDVSGYETLVKDVDELYDYLVAVADH